MKSFNDIKNGDRTEALRKTLDRLASDLITNPLKLLEFSDNWRNGFHHYSFNNLLLIWVQDPKSTICAGYKTWARNKRNVKKGAKALWVLAPRFTKRTYVVEDPETGEEEERENQRLTGFFNVGVFDISQTEGEPLDIGANKAKFNGTKWTPEELSEAFPEYELMREDALSDGSTNGTYIKVSNRKNKAQEACAYLHEVAHNVLGHIKKDGSQNLLQLSRETQELEAESTAFLVASILGIENKGAALYISNWHGDKKGIENSALKMLTAAENMVNKIAGIKKRDRQEYDKPAQEISNEQK